MQVEGSSKTKIAFQIEHQHQDFDQTSVFALTRVSSLLYWNFLHFL